MVSPLDRKLLRDLWRIKMQAIAIMLVIGVGVLLLVMMNGLVNSLDETRQAYYDRFRIADVFAPVERAPASVLKQIEEIDGVRSVDHRVVGGALINIEGLATPIRAQAVSLPDYREARLNEVYLAGGRKLEGRRPDDILLLEGFAKAHGFAPGDSIQATMHGARRTFRIVGLAQSPEFIYTTAPGEIAPDDRRFAVIWMTETALAAAFDVDGAFNQALIALDRGAQPKAVVSAVDRILEPYGGTGAYALEDQISNRFITEEINSLRVSALFVPPVFMAVAAFLLYIVISRMVAAERTQIGLLKAFGYSGAEVGLHYFKLVAIIAAGGALIGCALGVLSGQAMAEIYQKYYKFPFLLFNVDPRAFILAVSVSILSAAAGGVFVLQRIFQLTPAEAMRPPAPADYSSSAQLFEWLKQYLDQPTRMIIRRLARQPVRALSAILGIAAGTGISVAMMGVQGGFTKSLELNFSVIDRSDALVSFIEPLSDETLYELLQMPGVIEVEPTRSVPVVFRNGVYAHRGELSGLISSPRLNRPMSKDFTPIFIRDDGVTLSSALANKLNVTPGDILSVDVREGRQPDLRLPVAGVSETLFGAPAFFELNALNRALKEPGRISGAFIRIDADQAEDTYTRIKDMPSVAGLSVKSEARASVQKIMDEGAGAMRFVMTGIAAIITFGIIFNSARIAFAERAHDLASIRVMGFTRAEAAYVLLGEFAVILLLAVPLGILAGYGLADAIAAGFSNDLYTVPSDLNPHSIGLAAIVVIIAAVFSGWLVKRDVDRLDMVTALKSRE